MKKHEQILNLINQHIDSLKRDQKEAESKIARAFNSITCIGSGSYVLKEETVTDYLKIIKDYEELYKRKRIEWYYLKELKEKIEFIIEPSDLGGFD